MDLNNFIPCNFLGLEAQYADFENSKFVIIPVAYDLTTTYKSGTREGPQAIINASPSLELFDEDLKTEPYKAGIHTLPFLEQKSSSPPKMVETVKEVAGEIIRAQKIPIVIGGEHTVGLGNLQAFHENCESFSVLQLDAHADLRDKYQDSNYSHACVARRILELGLPLRQAGIRSLTKEGYDFTQKTSPDVLSTFYAKDIYHSQDWIEPLIESLSDNVYLTIDLDVFDPQVMPAVGTPEPGGLSWYLIIKLLKELAQRKKIIGFDVVELCPIPGLVAPQVLAAKLIYKLIGLLNLK